MRTKGSRLRSLVLPGLFAILPGIGTGCRSMQADMNKTEIVLEEFSPTDYSQAGKVIGKELSSAVCGIPRTIDGVFQAISLGSFQPFDHTGVYSDNPTDPNFKPKTSYSGNSSLNFLSYGLWSVPRGALNTFGGLWQIVSGTLNSGLQLVNFPTKRTPVLNNVTRVPTYALSPDNRGLPPTLAHGLNKVDEHASMRVEDPNREYLEQSLKDNTGQYSTGALVVDSVPAVRHLNGDSYNKYVLKKDSWTARCLRAIGETLWWIPSFGSGGGSSVGSGSGSGSGGGSDGGAGGS